MTWVLRNPGDTNAATKFQIFTGRTFPSPLEGALDNILEFSFWLNFIYQVKIDCLITNTRRKIQKILQKKNKLIFVKPA